MSTVEPAYFYHGATLFSGHLMNSIATLTDKGNGCVYPRNDSPGIGAPILGAAP